MCHKFIALLNQKNNVFDFDILKNKKKKRKKNKKKGDETFNEKVDFKIQDCFTHTDFSKPETIVVTEACDEHGNLLDANDSELSPSLKKFLKNMFHENKFRGTDIINSFIRNYVGDMCDDEVLEGLVERGCTVDLFESVEKQVRKQPQKEQCQPRGEREL